MYAFKVVATTLIILMMLAVLSVAHDMKSKSKNGAVVAFILTYAAAIGAIWC